MHLKRLLNFPRTIGYKVAAWYSGIFILSSMALFFIIFFFLSSILKQQDADEILREINEIVSVYEYGGVSSLEHFILDNQVQRRTNPLFIRIFTEDNKTRFIFSIEKWQDFDLRRLEFITPDINRSWISLPAKDADYQLDITTACLHRGFLVQVGRSSQQREKVLKQFHRIFLMVMFPLFIIGLCGGIFLSYQTLSPIRNIIKKVKSLDVLTASETIPRSRTNDELDELAVLFNDMLANIRQLVLGMKHSLDHVAHDLRTPMTRMRNEAESALRHQDPVFLRKALEKSVEESERILRMLNTLMDISEAENGSMSLEKKKVNLSELIVNVSDMYRYVAEEKNIRFDVHISPDMNIELDPGRISQALANLVDNAVKFTPSGGRISVLAEMVEQHCEITVHDSGIGIPDEEIERIWDRLYRGDKSRSEKGLGLGLSLVKGIVDAHQGDLNVTSAPGEGSTFRIILS